MRAAVRLDPGELTRALLLLGALTTLGCSSKQPAATTSAAAVAAPREDQREQRFVDSVLAGMTLEEKVGQLNQVSGLGQPTGPGAAPGGFEQIRRGEVGSFLNVIGRDTVMRLQRIAVEQSRTRIPLLFALDVIHGFRTTFPVPLAEAGSWNPAAAERSARIAAREAAAQGISWT
ncbi:MAG: glycosyl hydrolase, partial [Gemmatimonadota bacterium]|nr:glycosyl hydrolase [Gemmatimonadota bacterium]